MKKVFLSLLTLALCSSVAMADVPDPAFCSVEPADALNGALVAPDQPVPVPASVNTISVRNSDNNAIPNAGVQVLFTLNNVECPNAMLEGTTNSAGIVTITLALGGCAHLVPGAAVVKANGVTIRSYQHAKSPDYDGAGGDLTVNLADLIQFSNEFLDVAPNECHDYDNNGNTGLEDLIIFGPPFLALNTCP